jgi:hypothetical protein
LIHRYDEIRQQVIWQTVTSELQPLRTQLEALATSSSEKKGGLIEVLVMIRKMIHTAIKNRIFLI